MPNANIQTYKYQYQYSYRKVQVPVQYLYEYSTSTTGYGTGTCTGRVISALATHGPTTTWFHVKQQYEARAGLGAICCLRWSMTSYLRHYFLCLYFRPLHHHHRTTIIIFYPTTTVFSTIPCQHFKSTETADLPALYLLILS